MQGLDFQVPKILTSVWLKTNCLKCSVTRASVEGWIFKRPEPLDSSSENLAEFQCKPGFRNLLYLHWAQRDRLSCKFVPSLGGTEFYWFQHALWLDQTSSACDLWAPYLKALPWQQGQQPQWQRNGKWRKVKKGHPLVIDGDLPIIENEGESLISQVAWFVSELTLK